MSLGLFYKCSACKFEFGSGWSHHPPQAGLLLVCRGCGQRFHGLAQHSPWGAEGGEVVPVYRVDKRGKFSPTAMTLQACEVDVELESRIFKMIRFEPEGLDCPQCEAQACIRQTLEDGQPCPKCKKGRIRVAGEVEH